jgi:hypothetical protein
MDAEFFLVRVTGFLWVFDAFFFFSGRVCFARVIIIELITTHCFISGIIKNEFGTFLCIIIKIIQNKNHEQQQKQKSIGFHVTKRSLSGYLLILFDAYLSP